MSVKLAGAISALIAICFVMKSCTTVLVARVVSRLWLVAVEKTRWAWILEEIERTGDLLIEVITNGNRLPPR